MSTLIPYRILPAAADNKTFANVQMLSISQPLFYTITYLYTHQHLTQQNILQHLRPAENQRQQNPPQVKNSTAAHCIFTKGFVFVCFALLCLFVCLVFFVFLLLLLFCKSFSLHAPTHSPYMVLQRVEPSLHPVLPENKAICTTVTLFATDLTGPQYRHPISSSNHDLN